MFWTFSRCDTRRESRESPLRGVREPQLKRTRRAYPRNRFFGSSFFAEAAAGIKRQQKSFAEKAPPLFAQTLFTAATSFPYEEATEDTQKKSLKGPFRKSSAPESKKNDRYRAEKREWTSAKFVRYIRGN